MYYDKFIEKLTNGAVKKYSDFEILAKNSGVFLHRISFYTTNKEEDPNITCYNFIKKLIPDLVIENPLEFNLYIFLNNKECEYVERMLTAIQQKYIPSSYIEPYNPKAKLSQNVDSMLRELNDRAITEEEFLFLSYYTSF